MEIVGKAQRVRFYLGEADRAPHGGSLERVILETLRREGCAGATAFRGIAGFGKSSRLRSTVQEILSMDLPVVIEWVDQPSRVERVLPLLQDLVRDGLITVEEVSVVKYSAESHGGRGT